MSNLTPHRPTQCFFDSVLVPMPTFLFLASLPTMVARRRRRGGHVNNYLYPRSSPYPFPLTNGGSSSGSSGSGGRNANTLHRYPTTNRQSVATLLQRLLPSLGYYGAVAVILLMQSVEIVQLRESFADAAATATPAPTPTNRNDK
ncbi:uncharacterized protein PG986_012289 [Apiospora aurea]|uniref:Uncharacterized protein n=1 Tax=Apiospora aurea TaxID=335848 RepID=A0ABR1Q0Q3_9PEZI